MSGKPYTYESVEYSDGVYHTVFNAAGHKVADYESEEAAKRFCQGVNGVPARTRESDNA